MRRTRDSSSGSAPSRDRARGHLAEFGIIEPQGIWHVGRLRARIEDESTIPEPGRTVLGFLVGQLDQLDQRIAQVGAEILAWHRAIRSVSAWPGSPASGL